MRHLALLALALAACEGGGKSTTSDSGSSSGTTTEGDSAGTTTAATSTSTTATASTTDQPTTATTDQPVCADLNAIECELAAHCMSILGDPLNFPGCTPGQTFLFCNEDVPCDAVILTVCNEQSGEVYRLQNGCIPPGFSTCTPDLGPCGGVDCIGLPEQACLAASECNAFYGAPHTTQMGMECADFKNSVFLACDVDGPPCPPNVVTVCPQDQPDTAFDVAAGCVPPGFVSCMNGPLPECQ